MRTRAGTHAAAVVLALVLGTARASGAAEPWSRALADEADTVVAIAGNALLRGPFHLGSAETLWVAPAGERLSRIAVSPAGTRVAWLSASGDRDLASLWVSDAMGTGRVAVFRSLVPSDVGAVRYEPPNPSSADPDVRGARLLEPTRPLRGLTTHALAFRPGDDAVLFGTSDGIGIVPPDTGRARVASRALAVTLRALDPAPVLLAEVLRLGKGTTSGRSEGSPFSRDPAGGTLPGDSPETFGQAKPGVRTEPGYYLMYPTAAGLAAFPAGDLGAGHPWAASAGTVWWSEGRRLMAVTAGDPTARTVVDDAKPIVWLGWDGTRHAVLRASGSRVTARGERDDAEAAALATGAPIREVLETDDGRARAVVTADSVTLWDAASDARESVALAGAAPERLIVLRDGTRVLAGHGASRTMRLWRVQGGRLEALAAPAVKNARLAVSPGRGALLVWSASTRAPATFQVWRLASPGWVEVDNPGLTGWEPLAR